MNPRAIELSYYFARKEEPPAGLLSKKEISDLEMVDFLTCLVLFRLLRKGELEARKR